MCVLLREMLPDELIAFRSYSISDYARELAGDMNISPEAALLQASQEFDELLPGSFLKIIEVDSFPIGVLWYLTEETDGVRHAFLNDFVIAPEHHRKGYARSTLTALAQEAQAQGCTEIRLYVSDDNYAAKALYERCGFQLLRPFSGGAYLHKTII